MRVRIVRKLANWVDGIDLTQCDVGGLIDLPDADAALIMAGRWAVPARRQADAMVSSALHSATEARMLEGRRVGAERRRSVTSIDLYQRLREKREAIERERRQFHRRALDAPTPHAA